MPEALVETTPAHKEAFDDFKTFIVKHAVWREISLEELLAIVAQSFGHVSVVEEAPVDWVDTFSVNFNMGVAAMMSQGELQ